MVPMLVVLGASGILASQMPTYETFLLARVINGSVVTAIFETYFTYVLEFVGGRWSVASSPALGAASTGPGVSTTAAAIWAARASTRSVHQSRAPVSVSQHYLVRSFFHRSSKLVVAYSWRLSFSTC